MSIGTHDTIRVNGSSDSLPPAAPARPATRPRDLLRLPAFAVPQPGDTDGTDEPADCRASGARCRLAMGYLD